MGFCRDGYVYSRDGQNLGWIEGKLVWKKEGLFVGQLMEIGGATVIVRNVLLAPATPRVPRNAPAVTLEKMPDPQPNRAPIALPIGYVDAFN